MEGGDGTNWIDIETILRVVGFSQDDIEPMVDNILAFSLVDDGNCQSNEFASTSCKCTRWLAPVQQCSSPVGVKIIYSLVVYNPGIVNGVQKSPACPF